MLNSFVRPFKGIIYNKNRIEDISSVVCPPYDVISDATVYYERSPFNSIRLELPIESPPLDRYNTAKETLKEWLDTGVLSYDIKDTFYIYEQEFKMDGSLYMRRGFIGLHRLDKKRFLTHEETGHKAKADRERLIATLKTFTSFIFGLYEDEGFAIEKLIIESKKDMVYEFVDEASIKNRFYRMTDEREIDSLATAMGERQIYVADGHHRLEVSFRLNIPYVPLYLTNIDSDGIIILPYHRMVRFSKKRGIQDFLNGKEGVFHIEKVPFIDERSIKDALNSISHYDEPTLILYFRDDLSHLYIIRAKGHVEMGDVHPSLKGLKVNILHSGILKGLFNIKDEEISYTHCLSDAIALLRTGQIDLACFFPPAKVEEVKEIAENGLSMPPKSTFFYPKVLTGLCFYKYA